MPAIPSQSKLRRIEIYREAAKRWEERSAERARTAQDFFNGKPVDSHERRAAFHLREGLRRISGAKLPGIAFERKIGPTLDWTYFAPSEEARIAGRPVARIVSVQGQGYVPEGFGTGFMVSERLLLTNFHVLPEPEYARDVGAQFEYEKSERGTKVGDIHMLEPGAFFLADQQLDFALVAVSGKPGTVQQYGFVRLIGGLGKILTGQPVNIIQHPEGEQKRYATSENNLIDILPKHLHYTTDTLPGSSGSPAFNNFWELVALHHSGVPKMVTGQIMTKRGTPWNENMSEDEIDWIANEGVRVSCIVDYLRATSVPNEKQIYLSELLQHTADPLKDTGAENTAVITTVPNKENAMANVLFNVQGQVTINVQANASATPAAPQQPALAVAATAAGAAPLITAAEKKMRFDPKYSRRKGYSPDFLKTFTVPVPNAKSEKDLVKGEDGKILILKYHHFSVAMSKSRRLQVWSAVNVSYDEKNRFKTDRADFGKDEWIFDPRLDDDLQICDDEFYKPATKVDRGHIVRRADNAWGESELEEEFANSDTFHWTNCTPQHKAFNRENLHGLWGALETQITEQIGAAENKLCILAGPVLESDDPKVDFGLGSIQYPLRFWKVVAAVDTEGAPFVSAFLLDQKPVVQRQGLEALTLEERMNFGRFERYQVPLTEIEALTGLVFDQSLQNHDTMRQQKRRKFTNFEELRLPARKAVPANA